MVFNQGLDLRYTWIYNPALGYTAQEVIGKRDAEIFENREDAEITEAIKAEVIRTGVGQRSEVRVRWRGVDRWYDLLVEPLRNANGGIVGVTCAAIDLTDRRQAETALLRSEKLASAGRMAAAIAHEINNPLEAVFNLLFLAAHSDGVPHEARQFLRLADEELRHVAHAARQSLGFYRESTAPLRTSLPALLDSAIEIMQRKIQTKHASVRTECRPVEITAIPGELRQVFCNLLANSLEAIGVHGRLTLRISGTILRPSGQPGVRITFADDGCGVAPSARPHLFEPFFTTKGLTGSGLGLWVSRQIIEKHSGAVQVRSATSGPRRGTSISILLPLEPDNPSAENPPAARPLV